MSLLFDENLSPRLPHALADVFPEAVHVTTCGLKSRDDEDVWQFAKNHGLTIVSKDGDFLYRSLFLGHPPKVLHLVIGNCSTKEVVDLMRARAGVINAFLAEPTEALLTLSK